MSGTPTIASGTPTTSRQASWLHDFPSPTGVRWFEAGPTYVLHWINAFEDGDEVVLDGFFQHDPSPQKREGAGNMASVYRYPDLDQLQTRPHRWRFNLAAGTTREESLSDRIMEFGMVNGTRRGLPYRYTYNVTGPIARVHLPERISSGTHSCWAPASALGDAPPAHP